MNQSRLAFRYMLALVSCFPLFTLAAPRTLTVGALAYGTVNWELTVIEREGFDRRHGFKMTIRELASPQAGKIALQSKAADLIVTDWIWVAQQRSRGEDFTSVPYSLTHGALIVPPKSSINTVKDLAGKRIGIAGGALDKNWLLLQALAKKQYHLALAETAEPVYGAPPLLNQQLLQGRLDAVLNYWHYAARLEAQGYKQLLNGGDILKGLGLSPPVPTLGYVFRERWAHGNQDMLDAFIRAAYQAKDAICSGDRVWVYVAPLTGSKDPKVQNLLRQRYCEGRLRSWGEDEMRTARKLYQILHALGGEKLTGPAPELPPGTFWTKFRLPR